MTLLIKLYCIARICEGLLPTRKSIRHICKNEMRLTPRIKKFGINLCFEFQKFQKIDDLMIAPVTDRNPRIFWIRNFPIDSRCSHTVGIKTIHRGSIEKSGNKTVEKDRITPCECLPVLKNIPPISFVMVDWSPLFIMKSNVKLIPRTAWIAMPPTQNKRQVFRREADQI